MTDHFICNRNLIYKRPLSFQTEIDGDESVLFCSSERISWFLETSDQKKNERKKSQNSFTVCN